MQNWNNFVQQQSNAHFLQLTPWGRLKQVHGWLTDYVSILENNQIIAGAQLLFRPLPFRLGTLAYLPMGPYVSNDDPELHKQLWIAIHSTAKKHHARFLKWEPGIIQSLPNFKSLGFQTSSHTIQPPRTVMINISDADDDIMKRMNQGTRRKIRQGLKNGITYYEGTQSDVDQFNAITQITGSRNEFGIHTADYYKKAYELFAPEYAALIMAEHEGDVLAGIMVFAVGETAWYLYGASSNTKRNLMASYGIQWQAIQWAKARGCKQYDMWGIPDEDEVTLEAQFQDRSDGLWGVYGFKRGWGGDIVRSAGTWDYVYNPIIYKLYQFVLTAKSR